jgi:geranylgeranyl diphosphate synthase, type II
LVVLQEYLRQKQALVDKALNSFLPSVSDPPSIVHEAIRYSAINGGKRIRPILTLAATEAVGGSVEDVMPVACAVEFVHAFSLIHDDLPCMDDDDYRRGKPTSHKVYGEAIALLAGDALFALAFEVATRAKAPHRQEQLLEVVRMLAEASGTRGMVGGQVMDIQAEGKQGLCLGDVEQIHARKTGALLAFSVSAGAILGGATNTQRKALEIYGKKIGLAFQIADDILNLEGDAKTLGKSVGSDLEQMKATYPSVLGIEDSRKVAQEAVGEAIDVLRDFDERAEPLRLIARYIVERDF